MSTTLALFFITTSSALGLPQGLLSAMCWAESGHRPSAVHHDDGNGDSLGICQIKIATAKLMGFTGTRDQLMDPMVNIKYAAKYLRKQLKRYSGNSPMAVSAYNAGTFVPGVENFAKNQRYVDMVFKAWAEGR